MIQYLVNGELVDPNGNPVGEPSSPFTSLSESVQTSLKEAGITTVEQARALGKDKLITLEGIGDKTAESILAL